MSGLEGDLCKGGGVMERHGLNDTRDREGEASSGQLGSRLEPDLFGRIGRLVDEIEALKLEREAGNALTARLRLGAVHARARLEKRASGN